MKDLGQHLTDVEGHMLSEVTSILGGFEPVNKVLVSWAPLSQLLPHLSLGCFLHEWSEERGTIVVEAVVS